MPALKVNKPWGHELILTEENLSYTAKILFIKAGHKLSLQYHDLKQETLTLVGGQAELIVGPTKDQLQTNLMKPFTGYTISPNTVHRLKAITDSLIFEASTAEVGTTYRLEDDYNRNNETDDIRNSQRKNE